MSHREIRHEINIFRPRGKNMRREVRVIMLILSAWLTAIVGFQLIVLMLQDHFSVVLNDLTFFNLPIHFWLTGQLLPLWFVILCAAFNLWMDRHTTQKKDASLRFRIPSAEKQHGTGA